MRVVKRITIIGSSGGGSGALGSNDNSVATILSGLKGIQNVEVTSTDILFITCPDGMDVAKHYAKEREASLWTTVIKVGKKVSFAELHCAYKGSLEDVNKYAIQIDEIISDHILNGEIDAIISISSDPEGINKRTTQAAIDVDIPIVGTGGSSLSYINTTGGRVIGSSGGSVSTTAVSRSVCFGSSLASYWGAEYRLVQAPEWPKFRSVCGAALPILLAIMLTKLASKSILNMLDSRPSNPSGNISIPVDLAYSLVGEKAYNLFRSNNGRGHFSESDRHSFSGLCHHIAMHWVSALIDVLEYSVIPVVVSALACLEGSKLGEMSLISGAAAGALLSRLKMGLIPAYISGSLTGLLLPYLLVVSSSYSILPSAVSIVSIGLSSMISGVLVLLGSVLYNIMATLFKSFLFPAIFRNILPILELITLGSLVQYLHLMGILVGCCVGYFVSLGSEEGYYHLILLPIIAIEMQYGDASVAGSFDILCLCLPCAGVCAGVWTLTVIDRRWKSQTNSSEPKNSELFHTQTRSRRKSKSSSADKIHSNDTTRLSNSQSIQKHAKLGWKGFASNIFFGDFVEACYPYTVSGGQYTSVQLQWVIRLACVAVGGILGQGWFLGIVNHVSANTGFQSENLAQGWHSDFVRSSAYVPFPVAVLLVETISRDFYLIAAGLAFFIPYIGTMVFLRL